MVFVKVRETYDLHTVQNKMTVIAIHTPKPSILKDNFPGLLMNTKLHRPVSCDVSVACASMLPLDPQGVGTAPGDVSPEDIFNPILYSAMSNKGMSQLEARINYLALRGTNAPGIDVDGASAMVDVDSVTPFTDEFDLYYGLLSNSHGWKKANPQSGLSMKNLKPFVYDILWNVGDSYGNMLGPQAGTHPPVTRSPPNTEGSAPASIQATGILGNAHPMPWLPNTEFSTASVVPGFPDMSDNTQTNNHSVDVPWLNVVVGSIIVPPSRLHQLFYRMVVEWTIEFSAIRPLSEIAGWAGLANIGSKSHYRSYDYSETKELLTGEKDTIFDSDTAMVSANVDVEKVM